MARAKRITLSAVDCVSTGPRHQPSWTVIIKVNDCVFTAVGRTKSAAKDEAARQALEDFGFYEI
ncbi:hypothetical protein FRC05_001902 [Tulasnella sp. 425]|nr:hypothetical protein FRC05_001902 [Tulasnella sp. 425]